jgi:hypothetical protein
VATVVVVGFGREVVVVFTNAVEAPVAELVDAYSVSYVVSEMSGSVVKSKGSGVVVSGSSDVVSISFSLFPSA